MSEESQSNVTVFNSALETGVRSLVILAANFPAALDLQRLVDLDYLVVHSGDVDGPKSLHPPLPWNSVRLNSQILSLRIPLRLRNCRKI